MPSIRKGEIRRSGSTGKLFVISAPSGAGKSTLCQRLLKSMPRVKMSVSYTTRKPRSGEKNDVHYSFISEKRFKGMIDRGEFAEWAMVHNNLYGTSLKRLKKLNKDGYDIILDIDTHGAAQIKKNYDNADFIFIFPPSMKELEKRLKKRKTDSKEVIQRRVKNARDEIARYTEYDYVIVNDKIDKAYRELESLVITSKLKTEKVDHTWIKTLLK
jgi:guanylate kinase